VNPECVRVRLAWHNSTMASAPASDSGELEARLRFERLLADLSSGFINVPSDEVDREIETAQRSVCESLGLDVSVVWQWPPHDPERWSVTHVYRKYEGPPVPEPMLAREHVPWSLSLVRVGTPLLVPTTASVPPEAARDQQTWNHFGIKATFGFPLSVGGSEPFGAVSFDSTAEGRIWPDELVQRLRLVGQAFANALARKRSDLALRESETRLKLAAEAANAGLWILDLRTGHYWLTPEARAMIGIPPDGDVTLERFLGLVDPDDREPIRRKIQEVVGSVSFGSIEYRVTGPDGSTRWLQSRGRPGLDTRGEPDRLLGVTLDVTSAKTAEQQRRESEVRLAEGAGLVGLGFYEVDNGVNVSYFDDRARAIFGIPAELDGGSPVLEFWLARVHAEDRQHVLDARRRMAAGEGDRIAVEYRYLHPAAGERWVHHLARVTLRNANGVETRTLGVVRDITDRRRIEEDLRRSLAEVAELKDRLEAESEYLRTEVGLARRSRAITGQSEAIGRVMHEVEQVAPTGAPVLVQGETGTGKELIAEAIHQQSTRRARVMVKVNCAALPSGLIESELFGREKGAYTGAMTRQIGRFEVADGSTLFLDEIGELSLEVQAKLLRVLESGQFERLGRPRTLKVDVRLIAATNRNLTEAIRQGRFREDLFYRLNVFPIRVPPLRDRAEDIPKLVWTLLEECSLRMGKKITKVPRSTMDALQRRPWPGNVRELRNVIEYAVIMSRGDTLAVPAIEESAPAGSSLSTLADVEYQHILRALEKTGWHIKGPSGAASLLGVHPATLYSRMKKLGLWPRPHDEAHQT
jgi:formate hydrogenlyase transcriptional activator